MSARSLNSNLIIGAVLGLFGLAATLASLNINPDPDGGWGARIFPLVGSGALLLLGGLECIKGLKFINSPEDSGDQKGPLAQIFSLLLLSFAYFWLMGKLGYLISTGLAIVFALFIFGVRNPVGLAIAAILCPIIYHLIFFVLLGVFPPYGEWFDLLEWIRGY